MNKQVVSLSNCFLFGASLHSFAELTVFVKVICEVIRESHS
jgi:hypothetical protein